MAPSELLQCYYWGNNNDCTNSTCLIHNDLPEVKTFSKNYLQNGSNGTYLEGFLTGCPAP